MRKDIFCMLLIIVLSSLFIFSCSSGSDSKKKIELSADMLKSINTLMEAGDFSINYRNYEVKINPILWNSIDIEQKENLALSFAIYCANKKNDSALISVIYDKRTGKKLARYNEHIGLKVY